MNKGLIDLLEQGFLEDMYLRINSISPRKKSHENWEENSIFVTK